jgi:pimeloyl-ACP methyl ester carboxylesterase
MIKTLGHQRDWVWRGWQIRYTYLRSKNIKESSQPPLILIHGFGASIPHWRKNLNALSDNYTVYALDLLGFGASKKAFANYNMELWSDLIFDFWQTFINTPAILVGNSLGSLVALTAVHRYPTMTCGLVMINLPDITSRREMIPKLIQPLITSIENIFTTPILLKPLFYFVRRPNIIRKWVGLAYHNPNAVTDELVAILANPPQDEDAVSAFCALAGATNQTHFADSAQKMLSTLKIPMLLLWGKQDRFIPVSIAPILVRANPRIDLQILEEMGHCPHDEAPELFNQLLLTWLNQHYQ